MGIPTEILWEWEWKFPYHGNPGVNCTICSAESIYHKINIDSLTNFLDIVNFCIQWCSHNSKSHFARNLLANRPGVGTLFYTRAIILLIKFFLIVRLGTKIHLLIEQYLYYVEQLLIGEHYCIYELVESLFLLPEDLITDADGRQIIIISLFMIS